MQEQQRYKTIKKVSLISATVNAILAISKILVGTWGHSAALVADGLHSFSDLLSDGFVIIAAKAGSRKPDTDHPYGHRRIETLGAIAIAIILLIIAVGLIIPSIHRILNPELVILPSRYVLLTAFISILANEGLYRYGNAKGKAINSNLLISNAWHNRSDAISSVIVLLSAAATMAGIHYVDSLAAILIAAMILKMGIKMVAAGINELIDTAVDPATLEKITHVVRACPGVVNCHQIRTRLHSGNILIDCHIMVRSKISVSEGHFIGDQVKHQLISSMKNISDVTVHIDSEDDDARPQNLQLANRSELESQLKAACAKLPGFNEIQYIRLHYLNQSIQVDLELPASLLQSHTATALEQQYQQATNTIPPIQQLRLLFSP